MTVLLPLAFLFQNGTVINWLATIPIFGSVVLFDIYAIKADSKTDIPDFISYLNTFWYLLFARPNPFVWSLLCSLITVLFIGSYFLSVKILDKLRVKKWGFPKAKLSGPSQKSPAKSFGKEA